MIKNLKGKQYIIIVFLLLAVMVLAGYYPTLGNHFVSYDDNLYVTENGPVQAGLTWAGFKWSFTTFHTGNWHPLTWLSHMLDAQLYGLNPKGHHLTNLLWHLVNTLLLFVILHGMTGSLGRSAAVAALFAVHPLHVESVAWAAERKDVLSAFFFLLAILIYTRYIRHSGWWYLLVFLFMALGLMAKPMPVTLPFVLVLLDYWPLNRIKIGEKDRATPYDPRIRPVSLSGVFIEKIPLLALSALSCVVTLKAQAHGGAVTSIETFSLPLRMANALTSYAAYLVKTILPLDLAVIYPFTTVIPAWKFTAAAVMLVGVTAFAVWAARRAPYFLVGWFWYLGTLIPVIGLVQVGLQSMADRYTYIPHIGLFIAIVWGGQNLLKRTRHGRAIFSLSIGTVLVIFCLLTRIQTGYWKDGHILFQRALAVTKDNYIAHNKLAEILIRVGKPNEAADHLNQALRLWPDFPEAHANLGLVLEGAGRRQEAVGHYQESLRLKPGLTAARYNLACALIDLGRSQEAVPQLQEVVRLRPDFARAHSKLGIILAQQGRIQEAASHFMTALQIDPNLAEAHHGYGLTLAMTGQLEKAIGHFKAALKTSPGDAVVYKNLGVAFLKLGDTQGAVQAFNQYLDLNPKDDQIQRVLSSLKNKKNNNTAD